MKLLRSRFTGLYLFGLVFLGASFVLRAALLIHQFADTDTRFQVIVETFVVGAVFDLLAYSCCVLPAAVVLLLAGDRFMRNRVVRVVSLAFYSAGVLLVIYGGAVEWFFWKEFGCRFNFIAVDYLVYTHEVIGNIRETQEYHFVPVTAGIVLATAALVAWNTRWIWRAFETVSHFAGRLKVAAFYLAVPLLTPVLLNSSFGDISENNYTRELAKNGLLSLVTAFFQNEIDYETFYRTRPNAEVFTRLRELLKTDDSRFVSDDLFDITREVKRDGPEKHCNVILVVVESLSAEFLGTFGNDKGLTPNLDALCQESLVFHKLYATGTRTVRGLEALALSLPPTPGSSVVKRPGMTGLFSAQQIFAARGYDTKFLYGGFGYFDNMNDFFRATAFETIDRTDISQEKGAVTWPGTIWGLCDEDLFTRVLKEGDKSFASQKPFFSMVMTTSNHRPFKWPKNKIDLPWGKREGGVKYTDYAIGQLVRRLKDRPWSANTILVIVADHCASSAGKVALPIDKYHIPAIVYAPGLVQPAVNETLCSQMDLMPTILGLMNFSYTTKFYGKDILHSPSNRALVGTYQRLGLYTAGKLVVLEPKKDTTTYRVGKDDEETRIAPDEGLLFDAVSYYQSAGYLLKNHLFQAK